MTRGDCSGQGRGGCLGAKQLIMGTITAQEVISIVFKFWNHFRFYKSLQKMSPEDFLYIPPINPAAVLAIHNHATITKCWETWAQHDDLNFRFYLGFSSFSTSSLFLSKIYVRKMHQTLLSSPLSLPTSGSFLTWSLSFMSLKNLNSNGHRFYWRMSFRLGLCNSFFPSQEDWSYGFGEKETKRWRSQVCRIIMTDHCCLALTSLRC